MKDNIIKIRGVEHKVIGIKNDRVIFQNIKKGYYTNQPSYKIRQNKDGYFVRIPNGWDSYDDIPIDTIIGKWAFFKKWCMLQN